MSWIVLALGAALSWGFYGPSLHSGQTKLGSPFRALLCVGLAYMVIGVVVPLVALATQGELSAKGWNMAGFTQATLAGGLVRRQQRSRRDVLALARGGDGLGAAQRGRRQGLVSQGRPTSCAFLRV